MTKNKRLAALLAGVSALSVVLAGCGEPAKTVASPPPPDKPDVRLITEVDGCKLYRVVSYPEGYYERTYLAKCGTTATTTQSQNCGKHCRRDVQTVTVQERAG